jgi:hypothetical protein
MAANTTTRKRAPKATAEQPKAKSDGLPTGAERRKLAQRVVKLREQGVKWDGDDGICQQLGLKGAPQGRKLMREFGAAEKIAPSYNRDEARERRERPQEAAAK